MQNVSEEFKTAIKEPSPEYESRITFPDLTLDDVPIKSIELNSLLVSGNDFEIGTAPMDMAKVELVVDEGEFGRNLLLSSNTAEVAEQPTGNDDSDIEVLGNVWGRNLALGTLGDILIATPNVSQAIKRQYDWAIDPFSIVGTPFAVSLYVKGVNVRENSSSTPRKRIGNDIVVAWGDTGAKSYYGTWYTFYIGETFSGRVQRVHTIADDREIAGISPIIDMHIQATADEAFAKEFKLELGDTATPWSPAPEDLTHGYNYNLSQPLQPDTWYTLSTDYTGEWQGLWIDDEYVGYLNEGKITFRSPNLIDTDSDIIIKVDDEEIPLTWVKLEKGNIATPWGLAPEDILDYDFESKECEIELGLVLSDESVEYLPIGKFTVEKAIKGSITTILDSVDRMYKAEKEYVSDLLYPVTILDILESACDQAGIPLATTTFANSDYIVPNEPVYEGITCRKVFAQVAELAGGYAKINRLGQLEILTLGTESVKNIDDFKYTINEVANAKIEKVIVKVGDETATKGDSEHIYTIVDNMFCQNPEDVIDAVYDVLKEVEYTAYTMNRWQGDFSLDLGDKVTIDSNETYILNRKLTYTGGLREDYSAPAKSNVEKESTGKGSMTLDIENVKTRIKVIDGEIQQTIERVENLVVGANNRLFDSQTEITFGFNEGNGEIQLFRDQTHPYYKVTSDQTIDLFAAFPDSQFAESLGELGEVTISLDVLVDVDRVVTIDGKEFDVKANRWTRIHVTKTFTENTTKRLRVRNPFSRKRTRDMGVGTKLIDELSVDINTLYYRNLKVERGNVATDWTLTPEELEVNVNRYKSEILQLADSISLRVSKGDIISEINQSAEEIRIQASKISLEGLVTANSNFKILEDGSIEAKNADITGTITSSAVTVTGGTITGTIIRTGSGSDRIELSSNLLRAYSGGTRRVQLDYDSLDFYTASNKLGGALSAIDDGSTPVLALDSNAGSIEIKNQQTSSRWAFVGCMGDVVHLDSSGLSGSSSLFLDGGTLALYGLNVEINATTGYIETMGDIRPLVTNAYNLGASSRRWNTIYSTNALNTGSDIRQKNSIKIIPDDFIGHIHEIKPKQYEMNGKIHFGYIAQDVERMLYRYATKNGYGKKAKDFVDKFSFLNKDESYLSLAYAEIEALKMAATESRINEIENRLSLLETSKGV